MTLRRIVPATVTALVFAMIASASHAQASATQTTTGTSTIIQPISITSSTGLAFGTVIRPASGNGSVTIDATTGARTFSGTVAGMTSTTSRAAYTVTGEGGMNYSISVPVNFNLTGPSTIQVFLTSSATSGTLSGSLGGTGTSTFGVGGNFMISNGTQTGVYSGTFNVTVSYN